MRAKKNIFIAGHNGMVGSAIARKLGSLGHDNIITANRNELDLTSQAEVMDYFNRNNIGVVYNAAAKVGGIVGNDSFPADFIIDNITIQNNLERACLAAGVEKYVFLGSCCIYPKFCEQPMQEGSLLTGALEPTNTPYAVAKIAGIISCQSLSKQYGLKTVCPMPINLFGPGDNWHPTNSHIIPGLMRRLHFAKLNNDAKAVIWGSGNVRREYLHVDDCADAIIFLSDKFEQGEIINIGPGTELTTRETAETIAKVVGYKGELIQDTTRPDGTERKLADSSIIKNLGWHPKIDFIDALTDTYEHFKNDLAKNIRQ